MMIIKAGTETINLNDIRVSGDFVVLTFSQVLTENQFKALRTEPWKLYTLYTAQDGIETETLVSEYTGFSEPLEFNLTLKRGVSLQDEVMQQQGALKEMAQSLPDEAAVQYKEYFDEWAPAIEYKKGKRLRYDDNLFKVLQAHMSQEQYPPSVDTASLYTIINYPNQDEIPAWQSGLSYTKGIKVRHKNKVWISGIDNNIYEPGGEEIYDPIWKEVVEE